MTDTHEATPALPGFDERTSINWLVGELHAVRGWLFAGELCLRCGIPVTEDNKRRFRRLASESALIISGQKGYIHVEWAKAEEIDHCCNALLSQAKELTARALRLRKTAHALIG